MQLQQKCRVIKLTLNGVKT